MAISICNNKKKQKEKIENYKPDTVKKNITTSTMWP